MRSLGLFIFALIIVATLAPNRGAARVPLPVTGLICHPGEPIPTPCLPPPK